MEYNNEQAANLITGRKQYKLFYYNVFGWKQYFTLEPTFATPTGKLWNEGFPRVVKIDVEGNVKPTKLTEL
jgi:hypothetical protein